jgi:hypothetical protein
MVDQMVDKMDARTVVLMVAQTGNLREQKMAAM